MDTFTRPSIRPSTTAPQATTTTAANGRVSITPRKSVMNNEKGILSPKSTNKLNNITPSGKSKSVAFNVDGITPNRPALNSSAIKSPTKYSYSTGGNGSAAGEQQSIRVLVRPRTHNGDTSTVCVVGSDCIVYKSATNMSNKPVEFTFDAALTDTASQADVYELSKAADMCDDVCNGYNAGIMLYGQTNAGKTYTSGISCRLDTPEPEQGLAPRIIQQLLDCISSKNVDAAGSIKYSLSCQYIEIYLEKVYDLLGQKKPQLKLGLDTDRNFCAQGATVKPIESMADGMKMMQDGFAQRTTAATNKNKQSSRSHALVIFIITQSCESTNEFGECVTEKRVSKFYLADLAGSETSSATDGLSRELREQGSSINLSLMTLRLVLKALTDKNANQLPPYNDSELTRLLKPCTGGSAKTVFIGCIHTDVDNEAAAQTLSTLQYCSMAKKITNQVKQAKSVVTKEYLQQENADLKQYLTHIKDEVAAVLGPQFQSPVHTGANKPILSPNIKPNSLFGNENINTMNDAMTTPSKQAGAHYKFVFSPNTTQLTKQLDKVINKVRLSLRGSLATGSPGEADGKSTTYLRQQLQAQNEFVETLKHELECERLKCEDVTLQIQQYKQQNNQIQYELDELMQVKQQCDIAVNVAQHELDNAVHSETELKLQINALQAQLHQSQAETDMMSEQTAAQMSALESELSERKELFIEQLSVSELNYTELQCTLAQQKLQYEQAQSAAAQREADLQAQLDAKQQQHVEELFDVQSQVTSLTEQLVESKHINAEHCSTIDRLHNSHVTAAQEHSNVVAGLQQQIAQMKMIHTQQADSMHDTAQQHTAEVSELTAQIATASNTNVTLQAELVTVNKQMQSVQSELVASTTKIEHINATLSEATASHQVEAAAMNDKVNKLQDECTAYQMRVEQLGDEKVALQNNIDAQAESIAQLVHEADNNATENNNNIEMLKLQLAEQQITHEQAVGAMQTEVDELTSRMSELRDSEQVLIGKVQQMTALAKSAADEHALVVSSMTAQVHESQLAHERAKQELDNATADNIRLRVSLAHVTEQTSQSTTRAVAEITDLVQQLADEKAVTAQLTAVRQELQDLITQHTSMFGNMELAHEAAADEIQRLRNKLTQASEQQMDGANEFNSNIQTLNMHISEQRTEINRLIAVEHVLLNKVDAATELAMHMQVSQQSLQDTMDNQCTRIVDLHRTCEMLKAETQEQQQQLTRAQQQLIHATGEHAKSMALRADEADVLLSSVNRLNVKVKEQQGELLHVSEQMDVQHAELIQLKQQLCIAENESVQLTQLRQLNEKLLQQLKAIKVCADDQTKTIEVMTAQIAQLNQQTVQLTDDVSAAKQSRFDVESELLLANDELSAVSDALYAEQAHGNELRSHVIDLCLKSDQMREQLAEADYNWLIDVSTTNKQLKDVISEADQLKQSNQSMAEQISALQQAKAELDERVQKVEQAKQKTKSLAGKLAEELIVVKKALHHAEQSHAQQTLEHQQHEQRLMEDMQQLKQQILADAMDLDSHSQSAQHYTEQIQQLNETIAAHQTQAELSAKRLASAGEGLQQMHNKMQTLIKRKEEYKGLYKEMLNEKQGLQAVFDALSEQVQQLIIQQHAASSQPAAAIVNNYMYADTDNTVSVATVPMINERTLTSLLSPNVRDRDVTTARRNSAVAHDIEVLAQYKQANKGWCSIM